MSTSNTITAKLAQNAPAELKTLNRWVLFRLELNLETGKYTKIPYRTDGHGASVVNPDHWASFETCINKLEMSQKSNSAMKRFDGLGFVFNDDGVVGIDLDDVRDPVNGAIKEEAMDIINSIPGYKEVSVSGTGVHIISRGNPSWTGRRQMGSFSLEVYKRARYFTMSMETLEESSAVPSNSADLSYLEKYNERVNKQNTGQDPFENYKPRNESWTKERVKTEILDRLPDYSDYDNWLTVCRSLHHQFDGDEDGFELFNEYSSRPGSINYCGYSMARAKWDSFRNSKRMNLNTIGTLIFMRDQHEGAKTQTENPTNRPLLTKLKDERKSLKKIDWLVDGVIKSESLVMLGGAPSGGKTYVAIEILMCVASGLPVFGKYATKQGDAVYIACEGRDSMMRRTFAWEILKNNGKEVDPVYISEAEIVISTAENAYNSSESLAKFMEDSEINPRVIVIDTMNYSLGTSGENDANQMTEYFARIARNLIRKFKATVILVHHTNKDGSDIRGSSTIRGALDSLFLVGQENSQYKVKNDKHKDIDKLNPFYLESRAASFKLPDGTDESNIALFWSELRPSPQGFTQGQMMLLSLMEKRVGVLGEMTKADLIKDLGANRPNFAKNYLNPLIEADFISCSKAQVKLLKVEGTSNDFEI